MFNRQPFNRGKFNLESGEGIIHTTGTARMTMSTTPTKFIKDLNKVMTTSMILVAQNIPTLQYDGVAIGNILSGSTLKYTKIIYLDSNTSEMIMSTEASQTLGDEQTIYLPGIELYPGQELVINTTDMTITIDGQNAMRYFDRYSIFFDLLSGDNIIDYDDGSFSRNVYIDVLWKDRWL